MATVIEEQNYRCLNDCKQSGCPGHLARLDFQSVSNSYHFQTDKCTDVYFDENELEALIKLLVTLERRRADSVGIQEVIKVFNADRSDEEKFIDILSCNV